MKITLIREDKSSGKNALSTCEAGALPEKIKSETKAGYISGLRLVIPRLEGTNHSYAYIDKLPLIYPAVEYGRIKDGERVLKRYNGLVQLEVNKLASTQEVELVKRQVALLPQTFAAFCGSSGRSVKIWVRFALPDGKLPEKRERAALFHAHAYRMAVSCYQPILPFPIMLKEPLLTQNCRMTLDANPYYNPNAVPFCLEQPLAMPGEQTFNQRILGEKNPLLRLEPGYETSDTFSLRFETVIGRAFDEMEDWKREDWKKNKDLKPLLILLGEQCFKAGIPEEEAVRQTLMHYYREADEQIIRATLHGIYRESKGFGKKSSLTPEQEISLKLEEFMERRYEFRYNTISDDLEYRQRDSIHFYFRPVDQRERNSVAIDALQEGLRVWDRDVNRYLMSNRVPLHNPVEEYLDDTGTWDGKDRIRVLAALVPCDNPHWKDLFYRWFLSMVAHWRGIDKQHGNCTSPLLIGAQGYHKSTFCRILLPPELRFGYTDSLDFKSKRDAELSLGRFMLINLDEFDQINAGQQGFLKHLLQKPVANLRKPYGASIREVRRYASFIGTSNQKDLLNDPSGSRRFICIEVTAPIDTNVTINYKQLYAQAVHAIYKGERYWLDDRDEAVLKETNAEFEQVSPLEQLFNCYFKLPDSEEDGEWLSPVEILNVMRDNNREIKLINSNIISFGRILRKNGYRSKRTSKGMLYQVARL